MVDRPDKSGDESTNPVVRDLLLAALRGKPKLNERLVELAQTAFIPSLILCQAVEPSEDQRLATNYYEQTKFPDTGDQKRLPTNVKALELAKKNIDLHTDAAPTVKDGRITEVRLTDASEKAQLAAWLIFPHGYKDSEKTIARSGLVPGGEARIVADYHREGFRLAMKKEGFDIDGKAIPKGLTAGEQLQLDCITFRTLKAQQELGEQLSPLEQKALTDAADRLNKALASDDPAAFIKNVKAALAECKDEKARKVLLVGVTALLLDDKMGKPILDSFEKWLTTKYIDALDKELHKDPEKLKAWLKANDPDSLKNFPVDTSPEVLLKWLRKGHTLALAGRWKETMKELTDSKDQAAFQDLTNIVLGKKDRYGAAAGLFQALNDVALRQDGDPHKPADPDKVAAVIDKAGNDQGGVASRAREPGEFVTQPIVLPQEAEPTVWQRALQFAGIPIAWFIADVAGTYLSRMTVGRLWERAQLKPGWTLQVTKEGIKAVRDTTDVATRGKLGLKDPVLKYEVPTEEELLLSSRRGRGRTSDPREVPEPLRGTETVSFKGLEIVLPNGKTARDVVRELRRLENDKDFRKFLDEQIKNEKNEERKRQLEEKKAEYDRMGPDAKAKARKEVIDEVFEANREMIEAAKKGEARWRVGRVAGVSLIAALALGYAIKSLAQKQDDKPQPLVAPGVITDK